MAATAAACGFALDFIATVLMNAYMMARSRAVRSQSKTVRLMAERDDGEEGPAANEVCPWRMCAKMCVTDVLQT